MTSTHDSYDSIIKFVKVQFDFLGVQLQFMQKSCDSIYSSIKTRLEAWKQDLQNSTIVEILEEIRLKAQIDPNNREFKEYCKSTTNAQIKIFEEIRLLRKDFLKAKSSDSDSDRGISPEPEDLEDVPPRKRRRLRDKLIVDSETRLSKDYLRARIADHRVELRCESGADDMIVIRTPASTLMTRPTYSGPKPSGALGRPLGALFADRLANVGRTPAVDRPVEEVLFQRPAQREVEDTSVRKTIHEKTIQDLTIQDKTIQDLPIQDKTIQEQDIQDQVMQDISNRDISVRNLPDIEAIERDAMDIADLPTQKLATISQEKRASVIEKTVRPQPKKRSSQRLSNLDLSADANKENIPGAENVPVQEFVPEIPQIVLPPDEAPGRSSAEHRLTSMLQEAGLAEAQPRAASAGIEPATQRGRRTHPSDGSETPLGSLDRTRVSLGESEKTTDSKRFIDDQWGVNGTMIKIYQSIKNGIPQITVEKLVQRGPVIESRRRIIAARCFCSVLKLRSHGFIIVIKDPETNAIKHIELGPTITRGRQPIALL